MSKQYTVTQINTKLVVTVEAENAREAAIKGGKILGIRYGSQPTAGRQRKSGHNSTTTEVWSVGRKGCQILRDNYAVTEVATEQVAEVATEQVAEVAYDAEVEAAIERVTSEAPKFYVQTLTTAIIVEADSADMAVTVAAQTLEKVGSRLEVSKAPSLSYGETIAYRAGHRSLRCSERTVYWVQRA